MYRVCLGLCPSGHGVIAAKHAKAGLITPAQRCVTRYDPSVYYDPPTDFYLKKLHSDIPFTLYIPPITHYDRLWHVCFGRFTTGLLEGM